MKTIALVGGNASFRHFLSLAFPGSVVIYPDLEAAGRCALERPVEAILALAAPGQLLPTLTADGMRIFTRLREQGQKVYAEMYDAGDYSSSYLFGYISDTAERAFHNEYLVWEGKLLQARCASYLPGRSHGGGEVLARVEDCLGSHEVASPGKYQFPVLTRSGSFFSGAMRFSCFDRLTMLPHSRWKKFYASLFAPLLNVEAEKVEQAFEQVWPPIRLGGKENTLEKAVKLAVDWHLDAGIIHDGDGAHGCYEMIRSSDLNVRMNQRVDSMLLTGALFATAGRIWKQDEYVRKGCALVDYCLEQGLQFQEGPNRGLFRWFQKFQGGNDICYSSDSGRDGMAMLQMYRVTCKEKYLQSAIALGDAYLRWTEGKPFVKATSFNLGQYDLDTLPAVVPPSDAPVFYEGMAILLANLYRITGKEGYREQLRITTEAILQRHPHYKNCFTPLSQSFVFSRLITILCAAQEIGCGDYSEKINELLHFFEKLQHPCGGVQDSALILDESTFTHPEFPVSMGADKDEIVDMLYCTNNLMGCFSTVSSMKNPGKIQVELVKKMRNKMIRFLLDIQISEPNARLRGGWMRAYDMGSGEYFGVNKDKDWGAYCIMAGWVMGFLPLLLLEEMGAPSIYSIEKG